MQLKTNNLFAFFLLLSLSLFFASKSYSSFVSSNDCYNLCKSFDIISSWSLVKHSKWGERKTWGEKNYEKQQQQRQYNVLSSKFIQETKV